MRNTDVIIIGSGIGGLATGAILSQKGFKVQIFERHSSPGGYATAFERNGYLFDVSLHGMGGLSEGGMAREILRKCGVLEKIEPIRKSCAYSMEWKGQVIDIPDNVNDYIELLRELFPLERLEIDDFFQNISSFEKGLAAFNSKSKLFNSKLNEGFEVGVFYKWMMMTTEQVIRSFGLSAEFISFFTALWMYYGLPPSQLSALYFFIPWLGYHKEGSFYIKGGGQALSKAMMEVIEEHGGRVNLRSSVTEILYENERCIGIRLKNGDVWRANRIVSNASPHATYGMISGNVVTEASLAQLEGQKIGVSLSQLYIGLGCDPSELGIGEEALLFGGLSVEEDYRYAMEGNYASVGMKLTNYSRMDSTQSVPGKGVLTLTMVDHIDNWPKEKNVYRKRKQEVVTLMLDRLEQRYPGIYSQVVVAELGTPYTMRRYTSNPEGAVYGFAQTVSQSGIKRFKNGSTLYGLSFVGAWTQPGGGYLGALISGLKSAEDVEHKYFS